MLRLLLPTLVTSSVLVSPMIAVPTTYPTARKSDVVDTLHGTAVPDPYRWMEEIDSPETREFVKSQAALAEAHLGEIPQRNTIRNSLKKLWDYDRLGLPVTEGGRVFYSRRKGLQNQSVLYWKPAGGAEEKVLIDPNTLSKDGTIALSSWSVSRDGKKLAYSLSKAGSDWVEIFFRDVETGKDLPDSLKWVKFSRPSWNFDGTGVYYSRYAAPAPGQNLKAVNLNQKLHFHRLGEPQEKDPIIYERPDEPKWKFGAGETDDGAYLVIYASRSTDPVNAIFYRDLKKGADSPIKGLFTDWDADYSMVGNEGKDWFFLTDKDAPNKKLIQLSLDQPTAAARTILPETKHPLQSVAYLGGKLIVTRLVDAYDVVTVHDKSGSEEKRLSLPPFSSVSGFNGRQEAKETHYYVTNYLLPGQIYRYDVATSASTLVDEIKVAFDPAKYEATQAFYPSRDGTRIPLFLCHRKGMQRDGKNPVLLYGYGGFNNPLSPGFSPSTIAWLDLGGVYAVACLRGGGEYGREWHEAGRGLKKQNVFDDFIAAGEYLIREKITTPQKLGIHGGSNGGLLVAAALQQRPDLFGAAVPAVGVYDMLRFHKFTIGWAWQDEYGHLDNKADFENLLRYSPLHTIKPGTAYPPTLILTGDHDDRVFPAHSFKYAATLQAAQKGAAPILLRVDIDAGHGAGKPTSKALEETADKFAFFVKHLGM